MSEPTVEQLYAEACETGQRLRAARELVTTTERRSIAAQCEAQAARTACDAAEAADWAALEALAGCEVDPRSN
jgi:transcription elongation GreA/GreB family factor